jgi:hypothetical protein
VFEKRAFLAKKSDARRPADAFLQAHLVKERFMNTFNLNVIALAVGLAFSAGAMAQSLSKDDYKAGKDKIAAEYKLAKANCASLSGNPKDICVAEAKGKERVGLAELEAGYKPTSKNHYQARVARAEADYAVAKERCDDMAGNVKDVCMKEAKAAEAAAKADAKAQMKTMDATATASEKTDQAQSKANEQAADARKDATAAKLDADYKVAREKCDDMAGNAKDVCVKEAKARYGK